MFIEMPRVAVFGVNDDRKNTELGACNVAYPVKPVRENNRPVEPNRFETATGHECLRAVRYGTGRPLLIRYEGAPPLKGARERSFRLRRIQQDCRELFLSLPRQPENLHLGDGSLCGILSSGNDKIADRTPLDLRSAPDNRKSFGRYARLNPRCSISSLSHTILPK